MDGEETSSSSEINRNIFSFEDEVPLADKFYEYSDLLSNSDVPIVIDNGSYRCRVGWASDDQPRMIFKNLIAKQKAKKSMETDILIGNDIGNLEVARWQLKSPFDRNIVTQFDVQEQMFDYTFSHLGINTEGCVQHPIVMTEPVCNPNYCRDKMSELLFEYYHVPSVAYGIDALFSYHYNNDDNSSNGLVVSFGYQTTHVLPVLGGHLQPSFCRRLNYGGATIDGFLQRILQLKYPGHAAAITLTRAEELVQKRCRIAVDFTSELNQWIDDAYYSANVYKIQLPYTQLAAASLSAEHLRGRREQQARRLRELNIRRRQEKLVLEQDHLQQLMTIHEMIQNTEDDEASESVQRLLQEAGVTSVDELLQLIDRLTISVNNLKSKMSGEDEEVVDVQDNLGAAAATKDDQQMKQLKTSRSEPQLKKMKLDKKTVDISRVPLDGDKETMDSWLEELRKQRQDILSSQAERKQRRTEMRKRRTHASQNRMKILTELAQNAKQKKDDTFGMNEDDWNVYKQISKDGGDSDSESEMDKLEELESYLREYDPSFKNSNQEEVVFDVAEYYRVHIALEQIRIPELMFQPSMLGIDQAGLAELIDFILAKFNPNDQQKLVQNIFLTGGCASFPNLSERLHKEIQEIRPFQSTFNIYTASNPLLDAWHGARKLAVSPNLAEHSMTLVDYEEKGGEYLREHCASNRYVPTPSQQ